MPSANTTVAIDNLTTVIAVLGSFIVTFMLVAIFTILAAWLTVTMFRSRDSMLGFPSAIFWAFLGALFYLIPNMYLVGSEYFDFWAVNWWRLIGFACFGMVIFCVYAMYALREKRDALGDKELMQGDGEYIDEKAKEDKDKWGDDEESSTPSRRTQELRERARQRRTGESRAKR